MKLVGATLPLAERSLAAVFEDRAAEHPHAVAVLADEGELSYADLDAAANRLSRLLVEDGAGPESVVAIALPRSHAAVVATLAVIKAGATYLPIDLDVPPGRAAVMLADAKPIALLTDARTAPVMADAATATVIVDSGPVLERLRRLSADRLAVDRAERFDLDRAFYVVYTSGWVCCILASPNGRGGSG